MKKNVLLHLLTVATLTLVAGYALAVDIKSMTELNCEYSERKVTTTTVRNDCGTVKTCKALARCLTVDNDVFKNEFGSDVTKATKAGEGLFYGSVLANNLRAIYSEFSGKNPRFLLTESPAICLAKPDGSCPQALSCALDKKVIGYSTVDAPTGKETLGSTAQGAAR